MGLNLSKPKLPKEILSEKMDKISDILGKLEERISQMEEKIKENSETLTNIHQKIKFLENVSASNEKKADHILESHAWKIMNFFNDVENFKEKNNLMPHDKFNCSEKKIKKSSKKLRKHSDLYHRARICVKDAKLLSANSINRSSEFETDQNSMICDNISNLSIIL